MTLQTSASRKRQGLAANTSRSKALQHASPGGLDVNTSTAFWTARCLSAWDISLVLQARFWSVRTHALTSNWRKDMADKYPLCHIAVETVPHRLGGCSHPDLNIKVKHRHGAAVGQIVQAIQSGKHGDCFTLHDAEGQDAGYCRLPTWMLQMPRIPSRPDILLLEDSEQAPGGHVLGISKLARLHLVEVTFTTDFALDAKVAAKSRQHQQLCQLLHDAGWRDVVLHIFVVGHTGVMGNDNRGILEALGVRPAMLADCLHQVAILGCRFSCDMLKAFWQNRPAAVEQSPDALASSQCRSALQASDGMATAARRGGRSEGQALTDAKGRGAAGKRSRPASCGAARKRCKAQTTLHLSTSHEQSRPQAYQPFVSPHMQSSGSYPQLSLRRSARLAAKLASVPETPGMTVVTPPQIGAKRPLPCPTYPPCKRIRLMVHQQPSMQVHLSSAFAASRSSARAVHSAADGPRLVHDPGGY